MDYKKVILIVIVLAILFFVGRYFYKRNKEDKARQEAIVAYNLANNLPANTPPPADINVPPPQQTNVGKHVKANGNAVNSRKFEDVTQIFRTYTNGEYIGNVAADISNGWIKVVTGSGAYVLVLPSQVTIY